MSDYARYMTNAYLLIFSWMVCIAVGGIVAYKLHDVIAHLLGHTVASAKREE